MELVDVRTVWWSPWAYVSTWMRNGTPFSPPCFFGVNSVLMQFT